MERAFAEAWPQDTDQRDIPNLLLTQPAQDSSALHLLFASNIYMPATADGYSQVVAATV